MELISDNTIALDVCGILNTASAVKAAHGATKVVSLFRRLLLLLLQQTVVTYHIAND